MSVELATSMCPFHRCGKHVSGEDFSIIFEMLKQCMHVHRVTKSLHEQYAGLIHQCKDEW